ncbi:hypothetical protein EYF80_065642 [Liparis tanakae]|uniref:Uncharacterized protein n=1 Tax=Liparis tanakae TaxID=230148 RepID=A0A4Z2E631_9TELE|nr:hypothetical protein EYF80_065642 [Liparis tanakae]
MKFKGGGASDPLTFRWLAVEPPESLHLPQVCSLPLSSPTLPSSLLFSSSLTSDDVSAVTAGAVTSLKEPREA